MVLIVNEIKSNTDARSLFSKNIGAVQIVLKHVPIVQVGTKYPLRISVIQESM